jgi:hypothetical protein
MTRFLLIGVTDVSATLSRKRPHSLDFHGDCLTESHMHIRIEVEPVKGT